VQNRLFSASSCPQFLQYLSAIISSQVVAGVLTVIMRSSTSPDTSLTDNGSNTGPLSVNRGIQVTILFREGAWI
jgi:hypothetical protein